MQPRRKLREDGAAGEHIGLAELPDAETPTGPEQEGNQNQS
jgi:hypothetical protein